MKKNGRRSGVQLYKCMACDRQFRGHVTASTDEIWHLYLENKQTVKEIASLTGLSPSTVKRRLSEITIECKQPELSGSGTIHLDATYFGRNTGVMAALESCTSKLLYMKHIAHEHVSDYEDAVRLISSCGYTIRGVVIDGLQPLFAALSDYPLQMCHFHMVAIVRRKLTKNPQLPAGKELLGLIYRLKSMKGSEFKAEFEGRKRRWHSFLVEKTTNSATGKTIYTHQRLRSAMVSINFYMKWLFTFEGINGMPNTNNILEGTFTDLKNNIRNYPGMSEDSRQRFMNGFFLAYKNKHNT